MKAGEVNVVTDLRDEMKGDMWWVWDRMFFTERAYKGIERGSEGMVA